MASSDISGPTFDADGQQTDQISYPECDGRVTTDGYESVRDDCGLVISDGSRTFLTNRPAPDESIETPEEKNPYPPADKCTTEGIR